MSLERWKKAQELFDKARALPAAERAAFISRECGDDVTLSAEVESLLGHAERAGSGFLAGIAAPSPVTQAAPRKPRPNSPPLDADVPAAALEAGLNLRGVPVDLIEGYTIVRELHRGGQGIVYQAIQKGTKRKVAIKILLEGPYASKSARRRFEREIELVARLRHANIVEVFHSGETADGRQYCVMDYVRGLPLDQYVKEKKLPLEEALQLFARVCEAVNYAHQRGVIHRDLKPNNILVDSEGSPKVLDFGLAKQMAGPEQTMVSLTGQVVGTLPYMSPEQAKGNPDEIDIRTDVYALGVILYEVLTGQYPYPVVGQMADVLNHIANTPPTPPSRTWKSGSGVSQRSTRKIRIGVCPIDGEVQTIVLRSLAKERQRRYQSAGELARDVEHYLRNEPIEAKRDKAWYLLKKAIRRHGSVIKFLIALTVTTPLMSIGLSLAILWYANERPNRIELTKDGRTVDAESGRPIQRGDRVTLRSYSNRDLAVWTGKRNSIVLAAMVDRPSLCGGGRVAVLGFGADADSQYAGQLCLFNAAGPYDKPIWHKSIEQDFVDKMPDDAWPRPKIDPHRKYESRGFSLSRAWMFDVFTDDQHPGPEIVAYFMHNPGSQGVLRICDLQGNMLFQAWQNGGLQEAYWMAQPGVLIFAAIKGDQDANEIGWDLPSNHPRIIFAIRPQPGDISSRWIQPYRPGEKPLFEGDTWRGEWYQPVWYKLPCPLNLANASTTTFWLTPPSDPRFDSNSFVELLCSLDGIRTPLGGPYAFEMIVDKNGNIQQRLPLSDQVRRTKAHDPTLPNPYDLQLLDWTQPTPPCGKSNSPAVGPARP